MNGRVYINLHLCVRVCACVRVCVVVHGHARVEFVRVSVR
jgi:hypothetical protein